MQHTSRFASTATVVSLCMLLGVFVLTALRCSIPAPGTRSYADQLEAHLKGSLTPDQIAASEALNHELDLLHAKVRIIEEAVLKEARDRPGADKIPEAQWFIDYSIVWTPGDPTSHPLLREAAMEISRRCESEGIISRLNHALETPRTATWLEVRAVIHEKPLPILRQLRVLVNIACARLHQEAAVHNTTAAGESLKTILRLARLFAHSHTTCLHQLLTHSFTDRATTLARSFAVAQPPDPALLAAFVAAFDETLRFPEPVDFVETERLYTLAIDEHHGDLAKHRWSAPGYIRRIDEFYAIAENRTRMTSLERVAHPFDFEEWTESRRRWWSTLDDSLKDLLPIDGILRNRDQAVCDASGVRLLLAIELFRADYGTLPDSLETLSPQYIAELPADPYAPDGRFRFNRIDPASDPHARDYLLYSVGADGIDNHGASPDGDKPGTPYRALLGHETGFDYVINRPY